MTPAIAKLSELDIKGRRVFVRVDFNVPLRKNGNRYEVADLTRINGALPTIEYIIKNQGKCILASHLGRPKGKRELRYSLEPVGQKLSELLNKDVVFTEDCIGDGPRGLSHQMRAGDVMLLENLRFHPGEEENNPEFTGKLLELCDVYVGDAFGTLHRAHASTFGVPKSVTEKGMGLLVQKELENLEPLRDNPKRPFALLMGGSKVSDKMGVLEFFLGKADKVFIGGAMAYAFLRAQGREVGKSQCDEKQVELASKLIGSLTARKIPLFLPLDHVASKAFGDVASAIETPGEDIPANLMGLDIGPKTVAAFLEELKNVETLFWNGPMGVFEEAAFAKGTTALAKGIAELSAKKMAGGGDVAAAIAKAGVETRFDFISTGGGATLEYLEGKDLPGLKVLELFART